MSCLLFNRTTCDAFNVVFLHKHEEQGDWDSNDNRTSVNDMNHSLMVSCSSIEKSPIATVYLLVASPRITLAKMKSIQGPIKAIKAV